VPAKKLVTFFCHSGLDIANKKSIEREIEEAKREAQRMKLEAKRNFRQKVIDFMENHSL
jgi:nucleoside diphosphate kinase